MRPLLIIGSAVLFVCGRSAAETVCEYHSPAALTMIYPNGIVNGASYIPPALPNSGIVQGSLFVIFGTDLSPTSSRFLD